MIANITLMPGEMQTNKFLVYANLTITFESAWDYGVSILVNRTQTIECFPANHTIELYNVETLDVANGGLQPFVFKLVP